jgi:hypothetical protein
VNVFGEGEDIWLPTKRLPHLRRVLRRFFEAALIIFLYLLAQYIVRLLTGEV